MVKDSIADVQTQRVGIELRIRVTFGDWTDRSLRG